MQPCLLKAEACGVSVFFFFFFFPGGYSRTLREDVLIMLFNRGSKINKNVSEVMLKGNSRTCWFCRGKKKNPLFIFKHGFFFFPEFGNERQESLVFKCFKKSLPLIFIHWGWKKKSEQEMSSRQWRFSRFLYEKLYHNAGLRDFRHPSIYIYIYCSLRLLSCYGKLLRIASAQSVLCLK